MHVLLCSCLVPGQQAAGGLGPQANFGYKITHTCLRGWMIRPVPGSRPAQLPQGPPTHPPESPAHGSVLAPAVNPAQMASRASMYCCTCMGRGSTVSRQSSVSWYSQLLSSGIMLQAPRELFTVCQQRLAGRRVHASGAEGSRCRCRDTPLTPSNSEKRYSRAQLHVREG